MTEYRYTTETWGPVFLQATYQWLAIPDIVEGYEGSCWLNVSEIVSVIPRKDGGSQITLRGDHLYNIKETPDEVMERLKEWKQHRT